MKVVSHNLLDVFIALEVERDMEFGQSKENGSSCSFLLKSAVRELREQVKDLANFCFRLIGAIFSQNPSNDLHQSVRNVWVLFEDLEVDFDCALAEFLTLFSTFVFRDRKYESVCELLSDLISTDFEQLVHVSDVPVLIWSELISKS